MCSVCIIYISVPFSPTESQQVALMCLLFFMQLPVLIARHSISSQYTFSRGYCDLDGVVCMIDDVLVHGRTVKVEYVLTAVGVIRLGFDCRKVCRRPVDVWRVSFYYHKGYWKPVVVQRFAFNCHKACRKPVEVRRVCVDCCRGCKSRF